MALIIKDRVKETTTTTGTGTITLAGASTGFRSFADIGNANTTYYCISGGSQFEVGLGTYTASGTTLSRDTVLSNSLGTTANIDFSAGTKDVFCTYPSGKAILGDTSAVASTGTGSVVLSASPTLTGAVNVDGGASNITLDSNSGVLIQYDGGGDTSIGQVSYGKTTYLSDDYINISSIPANKILGTSNINSDVIGKDVTGTGSVVLSDSPTMSVTGAGFTLQDATDNTKQAKFDLSGITTATTRTYTLPNTTGALATLGTIAQTFSGNVTCSNALIAQATITLSGNGSSNNVFSTGTTTGTTTIGGTGQTGALTLGQSTGTQTVNIATGVVGSGATKTVNIGTGSSSVGSTVVNIGQPIGGTNNGNLTVAIGRQTRSAGTTTIGIGNATVSGTGNTNITIGNATCTTSMNGNVIFNNLQLPAFVGQDTQIVDDLLTSTVGKRAFVTDASTPVFGMPVSGGGSTPVPVYYDGTTWRVG